MPPALQAPPSNDREDRAARTKAEVQAREKPKPKKVVRKKKPPIPVPSMSAPWQIATAPKPEPRRPARKPTIVDRVKPKPQPHGGHKPVKYMYTPIEDLLLPPQRGSEREREIRRYNQRRERIRRASVNERKAIEREARQERRAYLQGLDSERRRILLDNQSAQDFIRNGPKDELSALDIAQGAGSLFLSGGKAAAGYIDRAVTQWRTELSGGLSGRRAGMRREPTSQDYDINVVAGEALIGHDLLKATRGEDYDPRMALVEAALLFVPIRGLPTPITAGLRATLGAARFAKLWRKPGATAMDALKAAEWTKPVMTARAQRRAALRAADAPRSSSRAAGWVADRLPGGPDSRLARTVRNDPSDQREFRVEAGVVRTPKDLARTGRAVRALMDRYRGVLGKLPGITSNERMYDKILAQQGDTLAAQYAGIVARMADVLPRNRLGKVDWPGVYAVRAVLKGIPGENMIDRTAADLARAEQMGDELGARALRHHLAYFKAGLKYLQKKPDGSVALRDDAPAELEALRRAIADATDARENILKNLDLISEGRAQERILNEQLFYQGAEHMPKDDFIAQALQAHPVRQQADALLAERDPAQRVRGMTILDAQARTFYENLIREMDEKIEDLRHLVLQDVDEATINARYITLRRLQAERANLSPATFYDHFSEVRGDLPPDVVAEMVEEYGAEGIDWFFRMQDELSGVNSADFADFFSAAQRGEHAPAFIPRWHFQNPAHSEFYDDVRRYAGGFDDHIETSIPDFRGSQVRKGVAIAKAFPEAKVLDLMASTGAWGKALSERGLKTVSLDANAEMAAHFAKTDVPGARFVAEAFQEGFEDSGQYWPRYNPRERFDIVNETMGFQFISPDRATQVAEVKRLLKPGGVFFADQKVITPQWAEHEAAKDAWKAQFYSSDDIAKKAEAVLGDSVVGMRANMVTQEQLESVLRENFAHVRPYWESGNFRGYVASDDPAKLDAFFREYDATDVPRFTRETTGYEAGDVGREAPLPTLSPAVKARVSASEWLASTRGEDDARRIANEMFAEGLDLPPELDTPKKLQKAIDDVFQLAREGIDGKDWYPEAASGVMLVSEHTGVPPKQVAQLFAIYSQAADTVANSTFVFQAIREFQRYGDIFSGRFPVRQSEEAKAVLQGGKWEGRKRSSFYANILRHIPGLEDEYAAVIREMAEERGAEILHPVTVDRWVVRMFTPEAGKDVPGKFYDTMETIVQKMAASWGWEPEQIQAAAWVAMKDRGLQAEIEKAVAAGRRPRTTVRHIAGAEDAFQYGIRRQIEREAEEAAAGQLFDTTALEVTPQMKRLANQANKKWGGFTVDRDLQPVPAEGYSVTMSITETPFRLHGLTGADIAQFRDRWADMLKKDKRLKIGGFSDDQNATGDGTDVTYLSLTRHFKRRADAMKFAREQGQETFYEFKTGDGIRTGLSRDEQAAIVERLRREATPQVDELPPRVVLSTPEKAYDDILSQAAREFGYTKVGKRPTPSQKARAEEWLLKNSDQYPDEPLVKEWEAAYDASRVAPEEPAWMRDDAIQFRLRAGDYGVQPRALGTVDEAVGQRGAEIAQGIRGYKTAVKALERADIPYAFIKRVWQDPNLHLYDKVKVGLHLNRLADGGLRNRAFPDIPGAEKMFDQQVLGGMYIGKTRSVVMSTKGKTVDVLHEFFHGAEGQELLPEGLLDDMKEFVGAARGTPHRELTDHQAEDMADMWEAMFLGFDPKTSKLPRALREKMEEFSKAMRSGAQGRTKRAQAMLDRMPEEMRQNIEDALWFDAAAGQRKGMYGAKNVIVRPGGTYVPELPGLPFSFSQRMLGPRRYGTLYNRLKEGRKVQTLTPTDQALEHEFTARLLRSGRWGRDVTAGPLHGLIKAIEIEKMKYLRDGILDATTDVPKNVTDVAVPVDPLEFASREGREAKQELADLFALFDVMDKGTPVHAQKLDKVTINGIEQAKDFFFPGYSDVTRAEIEQLAANTIEPIPGVRWISRDHLDRTGVLAPPGLNARIGSTWAKRSLGAMDDANNILKLLTLSLNPSYYTMNLTGQGVMLLMQQGAFAPVSLARSLLNLHDLSPDTRAILQAHAGVGQASILAGQGGLTKQAVDLTHRFANAVIDTHPRMAAILYEARRLGYKTAAEIEDLLTNPANFQDLFTASRRANRSLVDFQNLTYAEREYLGRLIFVYPWLRASAKWAAQFPFDHPLQTAMFAGLIYWQQQRLKESFPEGHPGYLKWYFPIEGGEDPYGFRLDQAFTPLQPLDLAAEIAWLISGESVFPWGANEEALVGRMNPLIEEIFTAITGYDAFRQEEVQRSLLGFLRRLVDPSQRYASWTRIEKALKGETHKGLYDTNVVQNWLRVILGSLAPVDVNADVAADMAAPTRTVTVPEVSPEESERRFMNEVEAAAEAAGEPVPPELAEQYRAWQEYNRQESEFKREHRIERGLKPQERLAILLLTWGKVNGREADAEARIEQALAMTDAAAEDAIEEGREALGLSRIDRIKRRLSSQATEERPVVTR